MNEAAKEILYQQLRLLAERSKDYGCDGMCNISLAMAEIYKALQTTPVV